MQDVKERKKGGFILLSAKFITEIKNGEFES